MVCHWRADQLFAEAEGELRRTDKSLYLAVTVPSRIKSDRKEEKTRSRPLFVGSYLQVT